MTAPLRFEDGVLRILDQTRLPAEEEWLTVIPLRMLADRLHAARRSLRVNGERSLLGREATKEVAMIEAEYRRRQLVIPETPDVVPFPTRHAKKGGA